MPTDTSATDERIREETLLASLLKRPELGAIAGLVLVTLFFLFTANGTMFT
ncbi:ABC transporter permease, partial [Thioclava sp. BHET1]